MNCEDVKLQLALYVYGELTFDQEETLEQHMDACGGCRNELNVQRALHQELDREEAELPANLLNQCRRELRYGLRDTAASMKAASPAGLNLWQSVRGWFIPSASWLKPAGALALLTLGFVSARLTTTSNTLPVSSGSATMQAEPASTRVRTIQSSEGGGIQLVVEETRQHVMRGRLDDEQIRQLLLSAAKDPSDPGLRVESVELLTGRPQSVEIRKALLAALQHDPNPGVRLKAIEGLRTFGGDPETRKVLSQVLLSDDNPGVRTQAIDVLMQNKQADMVGVLQEVLKKEDNNYVRLRSQKALREMNASVETF